MWADIHMHLLKSAVVWERSKGQVLEFFRPCSTDEEKAAGEFLLARIENDPVARCSLQLVNAQGVAEYHWEHRASAVDLV